MVTVEATLVDEPAALSKTVRAALLYVCQQALANIVQHAQAQHVQIKLTTATDHLCLEIIDDGCGFEIPQHWVTIVRQGHFGLASVQERVEAVAGDFHLNSTPGKGTTIRVIAPISSTQINQLS